jgi:kynurenine formamidase
LNDDPFSAVRTLANRVSNWGRWGDDDQVGTLNLIDAAAVRRGLNSARDGRAITLGLPFGASGPQTGEHGRFNPLHYMSRVGIAEPDDMPVYRWSDDILVMPLQASTQWDAFAHGHYDGLLYNNNRAVDVLSSRGASRVGIDKQAARAYATRGVLLDVAAQLKLERLQPGQHIPLEVMQETLRAQGGNIEPGDALLIRTGFIKTFTEDNDRATYMSATPGIGIDSVRWLAELGVSMVASDTMMLEVMPWLDGTIMPVHALLLRDMGTPIGEIFYLEELAQLCIERGDWAFQFVAQPLAVEGGVGSPVNPVAIL